MSPEEAHRRGLDDPGRPYPADYDDWPMIVQQYYEMGRIAAVEARCALDSPTTPAVR